MLYGKLQYYIQPRRPGFYVGTPGNWLEKRWKCSLQRVTGKWVKIFSAKKGALHLFFISIRLFGSSSSMLRVLPNWGLNYAYSMLVWVRVILSILVFHNVFYHSTRMFHFHVEIYIFTYGSTFSKGRFTKSASKTFYFFKITISNFPSIYAPS